MSMMGLIGTASESLWVISNTGGQKGRKLLNSFEIYLFQWCLPNLALRSLVYPVYNFPSEQ